MRFFEEGSGQNFWSRSALGLQTSQRILRREKNAKAQVSNADVASSPLPLNTSTPEVSSGPTLSALAAFAATEPTAASQAAGQEISNQDVALNTVRSTTGGAWVSSELAASANTAFAVAESKPTFTTTEFGDRKPRCPTWHDAVGEHGGKNNWFFRCIDIQ